MDWYVILIDGVYIAGQKNTFSAAQRKKAVSVYGCNIAACRKADKLNAQAANK